MTKINLIEGIKKNISNVKRYSINKIISLKNIFKKTLQPAFKTVISAVGPHKRLAVIVVLKLKPVH